MAIAYWDTSAVVPYYLPEPLSKQVQDRLRENGLAVSGLVEVEFFSVLARRVRTAELPRSHAERVGALFLAHLEEGLYRRLPIDSAHFQRARAWMGRFDTPLRVPDALHLAVAFLERLPLVTADRALGRSAASLGIQVDLLQQ